MALLANWSNGVPPSLITRLVTSGAGAFDRPGTVTGAGIHPVISRAAAMATATARRMLGARTRPPPVGEDWRRIGQRREPPRRPPRYRLRHPRRRSVSRGWWP